jgi:hypothetical protein
MQKVRCPHCWTELTNDGSLSGQTATCAACGKLFKMPELTPEAAPAEHHPEGPHDEPFDMAASRRRRAKGEHEAFRKFTIFALVILPLLILGGGILFMLIWSFFNAPPEQPAFPPAQKKKKMWR